MKNFGVILLGEIKTSRYFVAGEGRDGMCTLRLSEDEDRQCVDTQKITFFFIY